MFGWPHAPVLDHPAKIERRSWDRVLVQIMFFCQKAQGEDELCWSARVTDMSRGGIKLLSPHKFEPGTVIRVGKVDAAENPLRFLKALVVRAHRPPGEKWILGCAFAQPLTQAELVSWIDETGDLTACRPSSPAL